MGGKGPAYIVPCVCDWRDKNVEIDPPCGCEEHNARLFRDDVVHYRDGHWVRRCALEHRIAELEAQMEEAIITVLEDRSGLGAGKFTTVRPGLVHHLIESGGELREAGLHLQAWVDAHIAPPGTPSLSLEELRERYEGREDERAV